ncbi:MAG: hypothetical protein HC822_27875 [Oscillochloris sp.]|nr:hypothetical protein [Oscillochloris sp.]
MTNTLQHIQAGIAAEYRRDLPTARQCYQDAWDVATDHYEYCVAAHYLGHREPDAVAALRWHQEALAHAERVADDRVAAFYPSLYVNLGAAYERIGDHAAAQRFYALAANLGLAHQQELVRTSQLGTAS